MRSVGFHTKNIKSFKTRRIFAKKIRSNFKGMRVYFDYAATTPIDPDVEKAMKPYFGLPSAKFGNPNSLHSFGQIARGAVDESREKIAQTLGVGFREIIFTGSATEANNLALRGVVKGFRKRNGKSDGVRIIVSAIEHESVLETARDLESDGVEVVYLPVSRQGKIDLKKLKEALNEQTALVSVMRVNNEIGTIQDVVKISQVIKEFKISQNFSLYPIFHTDAAQAFQFLNCRVDELNVDLMTLSAHKIYGPKGIGALYFRDIKSNTSYLMPATTGGGQEFGWRSGTENVPAIVGFAKAIELAEENRAKETKRIMELKNYFWEKLKIIYPNAAINGFTPEKFEAVGLRHHNALPNILNIYFPRHSAEELLIKLDLRGIAVSRGSACVSFSAKPSYVLQSLGFPEKRINSSLRFSFGKFTQKEELGRTLKVLREITRD